MKPLELDMHPNNSCCAEYIDIAQLQFNKWLGRLLDEMQSYSVGMSLLSEEPFKELLNEHCKTWNINEVQKKTDNS